MFKRGDIVLVTLLSKKNRPRGIILKKWYQNRKNDYYNVSLMEGDYSKVPRILGIYANDLELDVIANMKKGKQHELRKS